MTIPPLSLSTLCTDGSGWTQKGAGVPGSLTQQLSLTSLLSPPASLLSPLPMILTALRPILSARLMGLIPSPPGTSPGARHRFLSLRYLCLSPDRPYHLSPLMSTTNSRIANFVCHMLLTCCGEASSPGAQASLNGLGHNKPPLSPPNVPYGRRTTVPRVNSLYMSLACGSSSLVASPSNLS